MHFRMQNMADMRHILIIEKAKQKGLVAHFDADKIASGKRRAIDVA